MIKHSLFNFIVQQLELFLNNSLHNDENTIKLLSSLTGKVVLLNIYGFNSKQIYSIHIKFHPQQIKFVINLNTKPDLIISGPVLSFFTLLITKNSLLAKQQGLVWQDNTHIANLVENLFLTLNIDWEEHLSHFIGDIAAHHVCYLIRQNIINLDFMFNSFTDMIHEYFFKELNFK